MLLMQFQTARPRASHNVTRRSAGACAHWRVGRQSVRLRCTDLQVPRAAGAQAAAVDQELADIDEFLASSEPGSEAKAVAKVGALVDAGQLKAFGRGRQVPKRIYTIEELRLNKIEPEKLLSPKDDSLNRVRTLAQGAALLGLSAVAWASNFDFSRVIGALATTTFIFGVDQVANNGGGEALLLDSLGRVLSPGYARRVALHEAGHFLVAYLTGLLPRAYTLSAWDAFTRYRVLNVQAGCQFCDGAFMSEVTRGSVSSASLDRVACVALAGVVTEYLRFGQAEGGLGDVAQLDGLLRALQFTQKKADAEVRWAVLNVAELLRRHAALHDSLAAAMAAGQPVGRLIALIEAHPGLDLAPAEPVTPASDTSS